MSLDDRPTGQPGGLSRKLEESLSCPIVLGELLLQFSQFGLGKQGSSLLTFPSVDK